MRTISDAGCVCRELTARASRYEDVPLMRETQSRSSQGGRSIKCALCAYAVRWLYGRRIETGTLLYALGSSGVKNNPSLSEAASSKLILNFTAIKQGPGEVNWNVQGSWEGQPQGRRADDGRPMCRKSAAKKKEEETRVTPIRGCVHNVR